MPGSAEQRTDERVSQRAKFAVLLAPAVIFYALLWATCTRSPILDDFDYLFPFAVHFAKTQGLAQKLLLLVTTQVGAYKAVSVYALLEVQLAVLGHMNFPAMILLGNLAIAGIFAVLARNLLRLAPAQRDAFYLLPVSLLIFNLNYAELVNWAVAGISPPMVVLWSLMAVHFLVNPDKRVRTIVLATVAGCLASFTVINGLLVWPVGILYLLLQERRLARWIVWIAGAAVSGFVCFFRYQTAGITAPSSLVSKLAFFVMVCGGAVENMHHRPLPYISAAIGVLGIGVFARACVRRFDRISPFFFYSTLWVMLTALTITQARTSMGIAVSLSSRYKIYCDLLLVFAYVYFLATAQSKAHDMKRSEALRRVMRLGMVSAALFFIAGNVGGYRFLAKRRNEADQAMTQYLDSGGALSPRYKQGDPPGPNEYADAERARELMNEAVRLGIYAPRRP